MNFLYAQVKYWVAIFFNILNMLLAGNLPPLGSACVLVKQEEKYLLLRRKHGGYVLPGGYMHWRERPEEAAQRECREETGLNIEIGSLIGVETFTSHHILRLSSLALIFEARVLGGTLLDQTLEGRPIWVNYEELDQIDEAYKPIIAVYKRQQGTVERIEQQ